MHDAIALGNAAAARTIKTNSVHFIEIGQRAVLFSEIANRSDRSNMPVH